MKLVSTLIRTGSAIALATAAVGSGALVAAPAAAQETPPQVAETASKQIPVGEFVKQSNMRSPRISPDGKNLAYLANNEGRAVLVLQSLTDLSKPARLILAAEEAREAGERTMSGFRWIGNDHVVMTMISRENLGGGLSDFRRLIAYDINDGELVQQAWRDSGGDAGVILHIDHDTGKYLIQRDSVANSTERWGFPEVVEVDVDSGRFKIIQRTNPVVSGWAADSEGNIRAGFSRDRDNGKVRMLYKAQGERNFKTVYNEADSTFTESIPAPQVFIPGTDKAYTTSRQDGYEKLYELDMLTMTLSEPVYETEGFDMQGIETNEDGSAIVGYNVFDGEMKTVYTDPTLATITSLLEEVFGEGAVTIVDNSADMSQIVAYAGGKERAGGFYLFNTQSGSLKLLNWTRTGLKDAPLNPVKAEWYTARDGTKIQAIVTYPRHRMGQKNLPVVVMPHGGPFGVISATNSGEPWNQPLAEAGYVVVQPNYRGSGGYGKAFEQMGREPDGYGKKMQDDLNDILTYYGEKGIIDPNRACVMGWSYGGYAAARGAQRDADVWKCAIAGAGVYDMAMMNRWDAKNLGRFSSGFQATSNDPDGISSAQNTDGPWSPILIVTAKRDARIPMEQAETLVSNLRKSGKVEGTDFRYIVQEQGTHNLPYDDVHIQWIEEAEAWLDKYNPAYIASDADEEPEKINFK
ncbi:alpha/beta hydrolase family protein [Pontixanthobacter gangjinensis]|uniref:Prolyl oligopeptidase family serine peptidase n=1 Tax=Pontixanthobacter gangjinensis TaxID=1028742 RepID=A0A6I4SNH5_9SPHN|nr:alpha/beta fold hydrolase [Pontixanthobacter gangjinensis]MXO57471.1 prolyl oligopeptidase family serine peptidase [Pontixanthobacter gangjinensis]